MTSPILKAVTRAAPGYEMTAHQISEAERNATPAQAAMWLPRLLRTMAESYTKDAPVSFDWRLVPVEWMLDAVDFADAKRGLVSDFSGIARRVGRERNFRMGYIVAQADAWGYREELDRISHLYLKYQGRYPDHAGLMFWLEALHRARGNQQARSDVFDALVKGLTE